jgi:hypothetical protein
MTTDTLDLASLLLLRVHVITGSQGRVRIRPWCDEDGEHSPECEQLIRALGFDDFAGFLDGLGIDATPNEGFHDGLPVSVRMAIDAWVKAERGSFADLVGDGRITPDGDVIADRLPGAVEAPQGEQERVLDPDARQQPRKAYGPASLRTPVRSDGLQNRRQGPPPRRSEGVRAPDGYPTATEPKGKVTR